MPYRENDARFGQFNSLGIMANALYDFFPTRQWSPYLGVGIGGLRVEESGRIVRGIGLGEDSDFQFAYQGIAGIKYAFNPNWSASVDYRYLATTDASLKAQYDGNYKALLCDAQCDLWNYLSLRAAAAAADPGGSSAAARRSGACRGSAAAGAAQFHRLLRVRPGDAHR